MQIYDSEQNTNGHFKVGTEGTTSKEGIAVLRLGNNIAKGNVSNSTGKIEFGTGSGKIITLNPPSNPSAAYNISLPAEAGTLLTSNTIIPVAKGGTGATTAAEALTKLGAAKSDHTHDEYLTYDDLGWTLIYDSGEIPEIANSIAGINVSGYTRFRVAVRCYNDGDSYGDRTGSAIFKAQNGKSYQFPVWTNMFSNSICTVSAIADFELTDEWLICPHASKIIGDIDIFTTSEGGTASNLTHTGSGIMKCTSPLSTLN